MTHLANHFVDPTIPGLSGRDLIERSIESVQATGAEAGGAYRAARTDFALRQGLSGLDRHRLRRLHFRRTPRHACVSRTPRRLTGGGRRCSLRQR